jgi:phospholipid N-methyltransferase
MSSLTFLKNFITQFHHTGALLPSSRWLASAITDPLCNREPGTPVQILEVGAGTGSFTREIIAKMRPGDSLTLYEINPEFCEILQKEIIDKAADDLTIQLVSGDVMEEGSGNHQYDFVLSGLPFNNFEPRDVEAFLALYMKVLKPAGILTFFEYLKVRDVKLRLPLKEEEHHRIKQIDDLVKLYKKRFSGSETAVFRNVPPAQVNKLVR